MALTRRIFLLATAFSAATPCATAFAADKNKDKDKDKDNKTGKRYNSRRHNKHLQQEQILPDHKKPGHKKPGHKDEERVESHDFENALAARKSGIIRPLTEILEEVGKTHKGEIVGVEIIKIKGVWIYEVRIVTPDNHLVEIYMDAMTKKIIKTRGK